MPGLAIRKAADLYPGQSKTDPRDAFIIANTARTMPHTQRTVDRNDEVLSALKMLSELDDDIARDCTRTINRLRRVLVQICPSLERVIPGDVIQCPFVLELLIHYGGPTKLKSSGKNRVLTWARNHAKKYPDRLIEDIFRALDAQTVTVPGTAAAEVAIPMLATNITSLKAQRESIAGQVEEILAEFPLGLGLLKS